MITLRRLNGREFVLNAELIEQLESAPDTVITLTTGNNIVVLEPLSEVIEKIMEYRRQVYSERADQMEMLSSCQNRHSGEGRNPNLKPDFKQLL